MRPLHVYFRCFFEIKFIVGIFFQIILKKMFRDELQRYTTEDYPVRDFISVTLFRSESYEHKFCLHF